MTPSEHAIDPALDAALESLGKTSTIHVSQVKAGVDAARAEVEALALPLGGTCDWGDCGRYADHIRWAPDMAEWLPVCPRHRKDDHES